MQSTLYTVLCLPTKEVKDTKEANYYILTKRTLDINLNLLNIVQ